MRRKTLRSFKPLADSRSKILILGTMPGPIALKKQEYYGFAGNHFWKIIYRLFGVKKNLNYMEKKQLLIKNRIAIWDVFKSCEREGALDSKIRCVESNNIPALLRKYPGIKAVFLNSRTAENAFLEYSAKFVTVPFYYLPSTSPANASISFEKKLKIWSQILKFL